VRNPAVQSFSRRFVGVLSLLMPGSCPSLVNGW
jgi:hypothetical protein